MFVVFTVNNATLQYKPTKLNGNTTNDDDTVSYDIKLILY